MEMIMLTYQLQNRVLKIIEGPSELTFPNILTINAKYGPPEAFGASMNPSRLVLKGIDAELIFNANTGRVLAQSIQKTNSPHVRITGDNSLYELKGQVLHIKTICEDSIELNNILLTCLHGLPALLNIEFPDPPILISLNGILGDSNFRYELQEAPFQFRPRTIKGLETHVMNSIINIHLLQGKFMASITYFHTASRLLVAGTSPWEFMAETILNFCKVLQILFGETMDQVRNGLGSIGYTSSEIEMDFIPLMVLRNHFDVGHAQRIIPNTEQLQVLYNYLSSSEDNIRYLLKQIFEQIVEGKLILSEQDNIGFKSTEQKKFDQLINTIRPRNQMSY